MKDLMEIKPSEAASLFSLPPTHPSGAGGLPAPLPGL